jgi:hypothetical protein
MAKIRIGDVYEVQTAGGKAYLTFANRHKEFGELVRVSPTFVSAYAKNLCVTLREDEDSYYVFYPLALAVKHELVTYREHCPSDHTAFPKMRIEVPQRLGDSLWRVWDGESSGQAAELSPALSRLSIQAIWNHAMLISKLESHWRPWANDRKDTPSAELPKAVHAIPPASARVEHSLTFATKRAATSALDAILERGLTARVERVDTGSWIVTVSHAIDLDLDRFEVSLAMQAIAEVSGGAYDGWEVGPFP